jgi:eukaryotic-like serine/threonine-protein kinase
MKPTEWGNTGLVTSAELASAQPHERLVGGRYVIGPVIGKGSSAVVCRAHDIRTGTSYAIKLFRPESTTSDRRRQRRELALLAGLRHPGLVRMHHGGSDGDDSYVVMDLVEGPTLAERLKAGPMDVEDVRRLGLRLAEAVAYVHSCGVVHRDVKPANVLLGNGSGARLTDFGIARAVDSTVATEVGCVVGTAAYLAPEQARGEEVGAPADVYALGLLLLEAVKGAREYPGPAVESATARLFRAPVVPDELPGGFSDLLRAMTAADPAERPSASVVAALLAASGPRTGPRHRRAARRSRRGLLGIAAAALAVGGGATAAVLTATDSAPIQVAPVNATPVASFGTGP